MDEKYKKKINNFEPYRYRTNQEEIQNSSQFFYVTAFCANLGTKLKIITIWNFFLQILYTKNQNHFTC